MCLSLLVDAVSARNTVRYQEALDELRADDHPVNDEDLAHHSPTRYAHVNPYGRYRFDLDGKPDVEEQRLPGTVSSARARSAAPGRAPFSSK